MDIQESHPYRKLVLPDNALFELRPAPGKGWGAFATADLKRMTIVLEENAMFYTEPCFNTEQGKYAITFEELASKVAQLSDAQRAQISLLRVGGGDKEFGTIREAFMDNSFVIPIGSEPASRPWCGLQILASRFNHSCAPNACVISSRSIPNVKLMTTECVSAGEELTIGAVLHLEGLTKAERQIQLRRHSVFPADLVCLCTACSLSLEAQQESDMRRRFIRGLSFLIFGKDVVKEDNPFLSSSLIVPREADMRGSYCEEDLVLQGEELDPDLRHAAESFNIPLMKKLVCCTLVLALLEEEHALGPRPMLDGRVQDVLNDIMWQHIKDYGNLRAITSMVQVLIAFQNGRKWWFKNFMAFCAFYGCEDSGDKAGNEALRIKLNVPDSVNVDRPDKKLQQ